MEDVELANKKITELQQNINQFIEEESKILRVTAVSTAMKYNLVAFKLKLLQMSPNLKVDSGKRKRKDTEYLSIQVSKTSNVPKNSPLSFAFLQWDGEDREYIFFEDGVFVGWAMSERDQQSIEKMISLYSTRMVSAPLKEDMVFTYADKNDILADDDMFVVSKDPVEGYLGKMTFSYVLARSLKLDAIEVDVENAINKANQLKFDSTDKTLELDQPRMELAHLHKISSDMEARARVMEAPILLWDQPSSYTDLYLKAADYFGFIDRQNLIDKKLELPINYWTLENEHAKSIIGWRLEKMIIVLIIMAIVFYALDKSEWWQKQSWEKFFRKLIGIRKVTNNKDEEYEVVEEIYEIIEPKKK
eukprot:TRINITY_DN5723_c0_g1_i1.p1 TRINITY_DN5723_c0_g1~~TRINITY_DN5723_c0_g1_i1.p1  ORF type:complete len:398 (-),score=120.98 TRINITY_DN5723_c0_g1_i1:43-1125(-)